MSSDLNELIKFNSVELLSLYTTMVLKRLTTVVQPVEDCLSQLINVLEYNLNIMEVDRRWFFGTLKDHARLFNNEWRLNNVDGPDRGIIAYDTLLLVVFLKLGVENLLMTSVVHSSVVIEELAVLYFPKRPTLALKYLNQCHGLFDYLSSHSPGLEEVYIPRSDPTAFQNCMRFKNLRVLELGGRISDKALCYGLWNINKKSEKVLEMALKETKGLDSWLLSLPHLEVLRNNFIDEHTNSMRVTLGAAALLIQPKMETVVAVACWDTSTAIMHILDTEAKIKKSSIDDRKFHLTRLVIGCYEKIDEGWLKRLFRACPRLSILALLESDFILSHLDVFVELLNTVPLKELVLDTVNMKRLDLAALLVASSNLTDLLLHTTPPDLAQYQDLLPDKTTIYASPHSSISLLIRPENLPRNLNSLTLNFCATELDQEHCEMEDLLEDFKNIFKNFLSNFSVVKKLRLFNTSFLPASYVVFGCIEAALEGLQHIKHLSVIACNYISSEDFQPDEDGNSRSPLYSHFNSPLHYSNFRLLLPRLQKEPTFQSLCRLESLELDALYLSPRVDRMVAALRNSGVLVNICYSSKISDCLFNNVEMKKFP